MSEEAKSLLSNFELPEGNVTFISTDIEGSTELLQRLRIEYTDLLSDQGGGSI